MSPEQRIQLGEKVIMAASVLGCLIPPAVIALVAWLYLQLRAARREVAELRGKGSAPK